MTNTNITYNFSIRNNTKYDNPGIIRIIFNKENISDKKNDNYNEQSTILYNNIVSKIAPHVEHSFVNGDYHIVLKSFEGDQNTYNDIIEDFVQQYA